MNDGLHKYKLVILIYILLYKKRIAESYLFDKFCLIFLFSLYIKSFYLSHRSYFPTFKFSFFLSFLLVILLSSCTSIKYISKYLNNKYLYLVVLLCIIFTMLHLNNYFNQMSKSC